MQTTMKKLYYFLCSILVIISFTQCYYEEDEGGDYLNEYMYYEDDPVNLGENYKEYEENPFIKVEDQAVSTFSVDADGGSYANMRRFLNTNSMPPKEAIRIEEFINYFTFNYNDPAGDENVALNSDLSTCPWNSEHYLMRVGMKGKSIAYNQLPNANFVFLIDVSGSMGSEDKLPMLKNGFKLMADQLRDNDKVAIVTYAGSAGVLLESTSGTEKDKIKAAIDQLGSGGSTAGAEGIITAYEIAMENFIEGGNNRVILGSDGDFNVGPSSTDQLKALIKEKRDYGIFLTVLGVGTGNLNDYMMEQIANNGNGNYEYIDNANQLKKVFVYERAKFYTIAKDSKIQITFNAEKVDSYRLIGYENRLLNEDDFDNDTVDAGEIGAGQTISALYELVLKSTSESSVFANFDFRYKKPDETTSRELSHTIEGAPAIITEASENMRFATAVTAFGLILRESEYKGSANKQMVLDLASGSISYDQYAFKQEFLQLVNKID